MDIKDREKSNYTIMLETVLSALIGFCIGVGGVLICKKPTLITHTYQKCEKEVELSEDCEKAGRKIDCSGEKASDDRSQS